MDAYLDKFLNDLLCTSWSRVRTGCEALWMGVAPIELNLRCQLADDG